MDSRSGVRQRKAQFLSVSAFYLILSIDLDRSRISKDDILAKYASERGGNKEQIHMVVIGHVDAGKSTLMGRLLFELGQVQKKTMHKYEQESRKVGKQSFVYAWILDETGEER